MLESGSCLLVWQGAVAGGGLRFVRSAFAVVQSFFVRSLARRETPRESKNVPSPRFRQGESRRSFAAHSLFESEDTLSTKVRAVERALVVGCRRVREEGVEAEKEG